MDGVVAAVAQQRVVRITDPGSAGRRHTWDRGRRYGRSRGILSAARGGRRDEYQADESAGQEHRASCATDAGSRIGTRGTFHRRLADCEPRGMLLAVKGLASNTAAQMRGPANRQGIVRPSLPTRGWSGSPLLTFSTSRLHDSTTQMIHGRSAAQPARAVVCGVASMAPGQMARTSAIACSEESPPRIR